MTHGREAVHWRPTDQSLGLNSRSHPVLSTATTHGRAAVARRAVEDFSDATPAGGTDEVVPLIADLFVEKNGAFEDRVGILILVPKLLQHSWRVVRRVRSRWRFRDRGSAFFSNAISPL